MLVKAELHCHSTYSDGVSRPEDIVREALRRGLNVIAISDHNTFRGSRRAWEYARSENLVDRIIVIFANEVKTNYGDILVYCLEDPGIDEAPRDLSALIDWARERGCILVPAHPFDLRRDSLGDLVRRYRWDAIEAFNAKAPKGANERAFQIARELGIPVIAGSDAHVIDDIGLGATLIEADEFTPYSVIRAIRAGRTRVLPNYPSLYGRIKTLVKLLFMRAYSQLHPRRIS